jgi:hypothetical protein
MFLRLAALSSAALAILTAPAAARAAPDDTAPISATRAYIMTGGADAGPVQFQARIAGDGSDVAIDCDNNCAVRYREHFDFAWPEGAFTLALHLQTKDVNLATLWMTGSRELLIVYNVSQTQVRKVLEETMNFPPTFTINTDGNEQVVIPDWVDPSGNHTHPDAVTVFTWDGDKFVPKHRPWKSLAKP